MRHHQPKFVFAAELPSLHSIAPVSWQTPSLGVRETRSRPLIPKLRKALEAHRQNQFYVNMISADEIASRSLCAEPDLAVAVPEEIDEPIVSIE